MRPALQVIGVREGIHKVSGVYLVITRKGDLYFLADATVNIEPTAEDLAEIALCAAQEARRFDVEPRVAMLSFSSFGSTKHPLCDKVRRAVDLARYADPSLIIDGEIQGNIAVSAKKLEAAFPFSALKGGANVLIFPDLQSCNIACKLLGLNWRGGDAGPDPGRHGEAGASAAAWRGSGRHRQHDHDCGRRRAGQLDSGRRSCRDCRGQCWIRSDRAYNGSCRPIRHTGYWPGRLQMQQCRATGIKQVAKGSSGAVSAAFGR